MYLGAHEAKTLSPDGMHYAMAVVSIPLKHIFRLSFCLSNAHISWCHTGGALLAFKKAVTNSDGVFLNWHEQDADPCNWKGVGCDSHSKRVVNL
jgi:hypothetical protein